MIKKKYIVFVFFVSFLSSNFSFSQVTKAKIIYKVSVQRKKQENKPETNVSKRIDLIFEEMDNIYLQLLFNQNKFVFEEMEDLDLNYRMKSIRRMAKIGAGVGNKYYGSITEKIIFRESEIDGINYHITSGFDYYNWELVDETKTIDKYLCYKATTTYSYKNRKGTITNLDVTAWYTPQIPLPLGPKNYTGLPGLILELQEGPRTIYVTELIVNPEKNIKIAIPQKGKKVTEKEFEKITAKAYGNFMDSMKKN